jgi:hypothetical protein
MGAFRDAGDFFVADLPSDFPLGLVVAGRGFSIVNTLVFFLVMGKPLSGNFIDGRLYVIKVHPIPIRSLW